MKTFHIAVIPGDGIGKEVVPEGIRVLEAAGKRFGFQFEWKHFRLELRNLRQNRPHDARRRHRAAHALSTPSSSAQLVIRTFPITSRSGAC